MYGSGINCGVSIRGIWPCILTFAHFSEVAEVIAPDNASMVSNAISAGENGRLDFSSRPNKEVEANELAANFLIPPSAAHTHWRLHASLDDILHLKSTFKVSAMAMLRAAYTHGKLW